MAKVIDLAMVIELRDVDIEDLQRERGRLQRRNRALEQGSTRVDRENQQLEAENVRLRAENAELRRRVARNLQNAVEDGLYVAALQQQR